MKGCFFLQRRFATIGHNIALQLKERYGVEEFCAYVNLRTSFNFLKTQKDIKYTSLILDENIHNEYKNEKLDLNYLKHLEKEYGLPNLWPYLYTNRVVMFNQLVREYPYHTPHYTHEEMLRILQVNAKNIIEFLEREKPDFILHSAIGGGSYLLYEIAKKKGIKTLYLIINGLPNTTSVSERFGYLTGAEEIFKKNLLSLEHSPAQPPRYYEDAKKFLTQFRESPKSYSKVFSRKNQRTTQLTFTLKLLMRVGRSVKWLVRSLYRHFTAEERHDYTYIPPINYLKDGAKRILRNLLPIKYDEVNPGESFAFFPLHLEPEMSLLVLAPWHTDQLHVIRQIAKSLPVGFKLYVKEHPQMVAFRPRSYYKELKKIPNVKLINPATSSFEIIKSAKLVTVITGTVGWEATMLKKPVITFGDIFYNALSFVKNCRCMEKLPWQVKEQIENFNYNEEELLFFISAIMEDSAQNVDLLHLWRERTDLNKTKISLMPLTSLIAKKLGLG